MPHKNDESRTSWKEEIIITGNELVDRIRELVAEGDARRLIVRKPDGDSLPGIPLTAGVVVGGAVTLAACRTQAGSAAKAGQRSDFP